MYIHPKTGAMGRQNTTNSERTTFYKEVLNAIKDQDLFQVVTIDEGKKLDFRKIEVQIPESSAK